MAKCYSSADIFLFCSLADNQPLAVMESLACGTPVFGFKTGGVVEMITNGLNGHLVAQYDLDSLSDAILTLVSNLDSLSELSEAAKSTAVEKYDLKLMTRKYLSSTLFKASGKK